jgi:hypothetical protein
MHVWPTSALKWVLVFFSLSRGGLKKLTSGFVVLCVCACARARVCVCEREREREREREKGKLYLVKDSLENHTDLVLNYGRDKQTVATM